VFSARAGPETWGALARGAPRSALCGLRVAQGFALRFQSLAKETDAPLQEPSWPLGRYLAAPND
jgi:hypothetical protein